MIFSSSLFLFFFFPLSIFLYYFMGIFKKIILQNIVLIGLSLIFYSWAGIDYGKYILGLVFVVYLFGIIIEFLREAKFKHMVFIAGVAICILFGLLFYYKYYNFTVSIVNDFLGMKLSAKQIFVPLGISFIIFSAVSYIVDVYRGEEAGSIIDVALYILLFTKVVQGPIVQWKDFNKQVNSRKSSLDLFTAGIESVMIGLAKKTIVADTLGAVISSVLADLGIYALDRTTLWLCALAYMIQIYFDFSGYSDIAIGISRMFGFDFKENFNYPYVSSSISEFWRRWHISLGTWFREYLYIPLGGNRRGNVYFNLFVVFLATGIWHGASWNYIIWGVMNAVLIVVERACEKKEWYKKIPEILKHIFLMVFVYFSWIIFMTPNLDTAGQFIKGMFVRTETTIDFTWEYYFDNRALCMILIGIIGSFVGNMSRLKGYVQKFLSTKPGLAIKELILMLVFIIGILFMVNSTYSPFLYFQF